MNTTLQRFTRSAWFDLAVLSAVLLALFWCVAAFGDTGTSAPISDLPSAIPATAYAPISDLSSAIPAKPPADTGSPFTVVIAVATPLVIALLRRVAPKLPGAVLPFLAPVIGGVLDAGLRALDLHTDGLVTGLVSGSAGVGVHQAGKKLRRGVEGDPDTWSRSTLLVLCSLSSLLFLAPGCTNFRVTQSDASPERTITFDLRGTAWFSGHQAIANLKARQLDQEQSFGLDALDQRGPTNAVAVIQAATELLKAARP